MINASEVPLPFFQALTAIQLFPKNLWNQSQYTFYWNGL